MTKEKKPPRLTRDQLLAKCDDYEKEIARLNGLVKDNNDFDERVRKDLGEMLGHNLVPVSDRGYSGYNNHYERRELTVLSWRGIAFKMGELKADADYSICLEREQRLDRDLQGALTELDHIKHPERSIHRKQCACGNPDCKVQ